MSNTGHLGEKSNQKTQQKHQEIVLSHGICFLVFIPVDRSS